ncbi:hypothetical protein KIN20_006318 [Parelaphostrongylus tenuis]|uniref:Uncharacterized protein n=1 Tax=Parelaphostrongylus tenuis TaxID=148309 RepID=A0AAD5QGK4_PARTN|nr:hypothetical protein KIN20_006318 [Parelaphostrongylus tenuis]
MKLGSETKQSMQRLTLPDQPAVTGYTTNASKVQRIGSEEFGRIHHIFRTSTTPTTTSSNISLAPCKETLSQSLRRCSSQEDEDLSNPVRVIGVATTSVMQDLKSLHKHALGNSIRSSNARLRCT